jgi:hypothetical protein
MSLSVHSAIKNFGAVTSNACKAELVQLFQKKRL